MPPSAPMQLSLAKVRLHRFKAAFKPDDPITFRPFNVIIGRNGSGKSTVIEALQWVDTAIRVNVRRACDPYHGIHDIINLRSKVAERYFHIALEWMSSTNEKNQVYYDLKIKENEGFAEVAEEELSVPKGGGRFKAVWTKHGKRRVRPSRFWKPGGVIYTDADTLAVGIATSEAFASHIEGQYLTALEAFWARAVFLRLSPLGIAQGTRGVRSSSEPLLDEEGRLLPALLSDLSKDQQTNLIEAIKNVLPDIKGVKVAGRRSSRREEVFFSLLERMPHRGRSGRKLVPIPAWMLSEGTRRITAIFALLQHDPPPTLLCIEEIENGLDPWSVVGVLKELQSASRKGTQIIVTTHSPWLLDHVDVNDILQVQRVEGDTVYTRFAARSEVKDYIDRVPPGSIYVTEG